MLFYSQELKPGNPQSHSKAIQLSCHGDNWDGGDLDYYLKIRTASLFFLLPLPWPWDPIRLWKSKGIAFVNISSPWRSFKSLISEPRLPRSSGAPAVDALDLHLHVQHGGQGHSALWCVRSTHISTWSFQIQRGRVTHSLVDSISGIAWLLFAQNPNSFGIYCTLCSRNVFVFSPGWLSSAEHGMGFT